MAEQPPLHEVTTHAGAVFVEEAGWLVPAHFGDPRAEYEQARTGAALFDVSHRGKVEVTGPDAAAFLHNLSTNDIRNLTPDTGCEAFLATAKARAIAHVLIFRTGSSYWLDVAPGCAARVLQHLDHYLISEQVEFADRTANLAQLHLAGPQAESVLARAGAACQVRRHDWLGVPGYDLLCPRAEAPAVWRALMDAGARPAGREAFEALRIEAGTPAQGSEIDDNTFVPEVGRSRQAICYTKGCYLGQEPIVMARDRGQVNRTLLGVRLPHGLVPSGSLLYRDGKEVGRVTSSVLSPQLETAIGLAYVRRGNQEPGTLLEVEVDGQRHPAEVAGLPLGPASS